MVFFVVSFNANSFSTTQNKTNLSENNYFETISLATEGSGTYTTADQAAYAVTVYNGWGPWCSACLNEMPTLQTLSEEYKTTGLQVVGVVADYYSKSESDSTYPDQVHNVQQSYGITYPILLADKQFEEQIVPSMGGAFPGTWAVNSKGKIIDFVSGARSEKQWRALFNSWLKKTGGEKQETDAGGNTATTATTADTTSSSATSTRTESEAAK